MRFVSTQPLSLGFIGGGISSAIGYTHYAASHLDGRWELVAGVFSDRDDINQATAAEWRIDPARLYPSWQALIAAERDKLDAVVVLLPTPQHAEVLYALLDAKLPIICEKAMVASLAEADKLLQQYQREHHFLAVTFNYSGYPLVRELQALIQQDVLGEILHLELEMPQEGFVRPPDIAGHAAPPQAWRLHDDYIPTICLDLGVHLHHLAVFLTQQEASQVMADFKNYSEYPVIDNINLLLRYASGLSASLWMTKTAIGCRNGLRIRVFGRKGSAEWYQMEPEILKIATIDGSIKWLDRGRQGKVSSQARYNRMKVGHPAGFIEAFANLYVDIADALIEWQQTGQYQVPYVFDAVHARNGLALFHHATTAYHTGQWTHNE